MYAPINAVTGVPYLEGNIVKLTISATELNVLDDPRWLTFCQARSLGLKVKKGASGTHLVHYSEHKEKQQDGTEKKRTAVKRFVVFHASQVEGMPPYKA